MFSCESQQTETPTILRPSTFRPSEVVEFKALTIMSNLIMDWGVRYSKRHASKYEDLYMTIAYHIYNDPSETTKSIVLNPPLIIGKKMTLLRDPHCMICREKDSPSVHHKIHQRFQGPHTKDNLVRTDVGCHRIVHNVLKIDSGEDILLYRRDILHQKRIQRQTIHALAS
jgi:hypothetical protein